ncbi:MAG: hypothetical protein HF973_04325 [Chloroflexi bacterium]|nr:hypothetical protein [Chloroflexota bacterium]
MIEKTISTETARRLYDWLGRRHDVGERYERLAKERGLAFGMLPVRLWYR